MFQMWVDPKSNWRKGTVSRSLYAEDHNWVAKIFDEPSPYGIKGGRISKLQIEGICSYDRGWDVEPDENDYDLYLKTVANLESSPKDSEMFQPEFRNRKFPMGEGW